MAKATTLEVQQSVAKATMLERVIQVFTVAVPEAEQEKTVEHAVLHVVLVVVERCHMSAMDRGNTSKKPRTNMSVAAGISM